ncbi:MAG: preprotein translocase subunit SecY [Defluviitaleaceae bacterium]|nr:preprotein translocase subunit SecY [Defluviitaleaceae bacterium]
MFSVFANAWKITELRRKLLYMLLILAIYRLGAFVPIPGINLELLQAMRDEAGGVELLFFMIAGGGTGILMLGIAPYITSSIIMQLLTVAIPKLEQMKKEGEEGRKKINQITRCLTVVLAAIQGTAMIINFSGFFYTPGPFTFFIAILSLVTGTMFVMFLSELITEKGIGQGASFIIFANILSALPVSVRNMYDMAVTSPDNLVRVGGMLFFLLATMAFVVLVQGGERRIPVQYSKKMVGRQMYGGQSSYIPLKVNIAGVLSIIFAISLLQFPEMMGTFFQAGPTMQTVTQWLNMTHPFGAALYVVLIFFFTFFYTSFSINPVEMAENMKKNGGFVPGIRPGKPTSDYIARTVYRLSWIGGCAYAIIASIPTLLQWTLGLDVGFGGTTLLILTGVALEIVKQLESQLLMRHYKGFLS